mmetsp:Transcript_42450/g.68862  ORF Transcript_42450/g.68862 Transcript_42450/m.68862 type:complete len:85 (+) Transcript_42450:578-832(+)
MFMWLELHQIASQHNHLCVLLPPHPPGATAWRPSCGDKCALEELVISAKVFSGKKISNRSRREKEHTTPESKSTSANVSVAVQG